MFSKDTTETKLAVLEERMTSYEAMFKKIDQAIQLLGQTSQDISKMLAVHEEKLDNNSKNEHDILDQIKKIEEKNNQDHAAVLKKFDSLEEKFELKIKEDKSSIETRLKDAEAEIKDLNKTKFIALGMGIISSLIVTVVSQLAGGIFVEIFNNDNPPVQPQKMVREVSLNPPTIQDFYKFNSLK
jgi:hypothetical protein